MAYTNVDPHDLWRQSPAGENLSEKQFRLVAFNAAGEVVLAKEGERAFVLLNTPKQGEPCDVALPGPQVKVVAAVEVKAMQLLVAHGTEGKVGPAPTEKEVEESKKTGPHIIGTALATAAAGDVVSITSHPTGAVAPGTAY